MTCRKGLDSEFAAPEPPGDAGPCRLETHFIVRAGACEAPQNDDRFGFAIDGVPHFGPIDGVLPPLGVPERPLADGLDGPVQPLGNALPFEPTCPQFGGFEQLLIRRRFAVGFHGMLQDGDWRM